MKNGYGLGETFKNIISLVYTKLNYRNARLIRLPFYMRGKKYLIYGKGFTTGYNCRIEIFNINKVEDKKLIIGVNCKIGDYVHIAAGENIMIGDNCLMASKIYISDISHGSYTKDDSSSPLVAPDKRSLITNPVKIGSNVWIGEGVCILPGVTIGNGSIIGANAVVNKDVPSNSIAAGVPAKVIKKYDEDTKKWRSINGVDK